MRDGRNKPGDHDWTLDGVDEADAQATPETEEEPRLMTSRGVLTPAEIEALLRPDLPDDIGVPPEPRDVTPKLTPDLPLSNPQPSVSADHALAAARAPKLSRALARNTGLKAAVSLSEAQEIPAQMMSDLLSGKTGAIACFGTGSLETTALVCLTPEIVDALIAAACGAQIEALQVSGDWKLSAMDCALLEQLLAPIADLLADDVVLQSIETDMSYVSSLLPGGKLRVSEFAMSWQGHTSDLALVEAPASAIEQTQSSASPVEAAPTPPVTALLTARIASLSVPLSRLTDLKAGSTLLLGLPSDQPVEVLSGGRDGPVAFEGRVGRRGNQLAVKINRKRKTGL
ncbi:MAG: FliM/FliN family flagellar motor C-terminal domain-containing protein [Pseudomonadota bacterium]